MWPGIDCSTRRLLTRALVYAVVENLRDLGCDVETYKWDSSEHVKHIVEHSEQYERLVLKFMAKLGLPLRNADGTGCASTENDRPPSLATPGGVSSSSVSGQSTQRMPVVIDAAHARL